MIRYWVPESPRWLVRILITVFFGSGNYAIVAPYMAEVWPTGLRTSGMGLGYGVGNIGKIIGPLGLALIAGSSDYISPKATVDALPLPFLYFACWWALGAIAFWFIGSETKGRTFEEMDNTVGRRAAASP
jgi:putative MFS transporter